MMNGGWGMMNDGWGAMTPFGWVVMVVLWVSVIALVVWAVARVFPGGGGSGPSMGATGREGEPEDPLTLLDRRLALGEIDAQTYDEIRERLEAAREQRQVGR